MHEIVQVECLGREVKANRIDGELWFTAAEVAEMLGITRDRVNALYKDHAEEFRPGETQEIDLRKFAADAAGNSETRATGGKRGNLSNVRLFSLSGVDRLAMLSKGRRGAEVRGWCVGIRQRFRSGASAEITREQFDALRTQVATLAAERDAARIEAGNLRADLRLSIGSGRETAKLAATIFNECKAQRRRERAAEMFSDASLFAKAEEKLIALDEKILAALVRHGPFDTVGDLAKFVRVSLAKIGDSVSTLAARGLIHRVEGKVALKPNAPSVGEVKL